MLGCLPFYYFELYNNLVNYDRREKMRMNKMKVVRKTKESNTPSNILCKCIKWLTATVVLVVLANLVLMTFLLLPREQKDKLNKLKFI